jgi:hypothetical protein
MTNSHPLSAEDSVALVDLTHRYAAGVDLLDREAYARCFTETIEIDFGSFDASAVKVMTVQEWSDYCWNNLEGIDSSQHFITNHRLVADDDDRATIFAYVQAYHYLDGEGSYLLYGHYTFSARRSAEGWKLFRVRFDKTWETGDVGILDTGRERFAVGIASRQGASRDR